jgi:hypothetical protein
MSDPHEIWQFGQWIGRLDGGAARLGWSGGELILRVHKGRIRFVEGIDTGELCRRLSCETVGSIDLLEEARILAAKGQVSEIQAMGAAKELLQTNLRGWLLDPARELEAVEGEPDEVAGATVSITHTLVELVLSDTSGATASEILPDLDVVLGRSPQFLDLYGPLRLSEEADLIVSKITGERSAREVIDRATHDESEVLRLLAALVVTGILEPEPPDLLGADMDLLPAEEEETSPRRQVPVLWIAGAAAALIIVLLVIAFVMTRSERPDESVSAEFAASPALTWTLVIDMGCEPQDLQRVLKKAQENPKIVRPVAADSGEGEPCWRLVWGRFANQAAAEAAAQEIPNELRREGFEPHPIELADGQLEPPGATSR